MSAIIANSKQHACCLRMDLLQVTLQLVATPPRDQSGKSCDSGIDQQGWCLLSQSCLVAAFNMLSCQSGPESQAPSDDGHDDCVINHT